ncbi:MAG: RNA methyltransferase [Oscillospiraceae bacterium]|nr:RNA methyltransferase [Oscillospiraceae bacterium]
MKKLPEEYVKRMKVLLGGEYGAYESALEKEPVRAFRVNTDKISLSDFEKINIFGQEKIPYVQNGYYLNFDKVGNHPYHHAGIIYVQEPAAMAPAECIDINPDWKILDMCAAPGGKSSQLKNKLSEKGILVSNEIIPSRCKILTGNIERLGFTNCVTTCMDSNRIANLFPETFNMIMVDAPCSGEGMFRKEEIAIDEWSVDNVKRCAKRQSEILENAAKALAPDGYIVYATCTFSLEENEMTIDAFLSSHPEFEIVPVKEDVEKATESGIFFEGCSCADISFARRFYPHKNKGEGQFMAVLHNKCENHFSYKPKTSPIKIDKSVFSFLDDTLEDYNKENVAIYGDNFVYFPPNFEIKKGSAFMCGVTIGELRKNYIMPHHQFFMALGKHFKRKIELSPDSEEMKKYLRGEEFAVNSPNGWAVVTTEGCTVGGVKVVSSVAKNHYPKGLRIKGTQT